MTAHAAAHASFHLTTTQVAVGAALLAFLTAGLTAFLSHRSARDLESKRAQAALDLEDKRIAAALEVEQLRLAETREQEMVRWRRQELRDILSRLLTGADTMLDAWHNHAMARWMWISALSASAESDTTREADAEQRALYEEAARQWQRLALVVSEVELIASPPLVAAAVELHRTLESMRHHQRPASGVHEPVRTFEDDAQTVTAARRALVVAARQELEVDERVS